MTSLSNVSFADINPDFGNNTKAELLFNVEATYAEISNVLGINIGEYWWEPTFGTNLKRYLFEPCDVITAGKIHVEVINVIPFWIPYIELTPGTKVIADPDNGTFEIVIEFKYRGKSDIYRFSAILTKD